MSTTTSPGTVTQALCEARGVGHVFAQSGGRGLRVLDGIDLEVRPGEIVA